MFSLNLILHEDDFWQCETLPSLYGVGWSDHMTSHT